MGKYDNCIPETVKAVKELKAFDWITVNPPPVFKPTPITKFDVIRMKITEESPYDRKLRMLRPLRDTCSACTMCELGRRDAERDGTIRDPHVFSNMNPKRFVVVGQNPGWNELGDGVPFVGAAGANFNKVLHDNGLSRNDFYITNNVKCFTKGNTKPSTKHADRCKPYLSMELNLINPLLVITLGASAFEQLCPGVKYSNALKKITKSDEFNVKVFALYHPSPLNLSTRMEEFRDQMKVLCKLVKALKA